MATDETAPVDDDQTAVADSEEFKMSMEVDIQETGPCRKHIRVKIPQADIQHFRDSSLDEFCETAAVPGFRVGHVPRKLIERKFRKEVADQVKHKVLLQSLEQLAEENEFDPIDEPQLDVENIEIPDDADFEYEFDVEVRPQFELPAYEGLKIERPVREVTDADVASYRERFLLQYGKMVADEGPAAKGGYVNVSIEIRHDGRLLQTIEKRTVRIKPTLAFWDAELKGFDKLMAGVKAGDTREADLTVSSEAESVEMRNETVQARFIVHEVQRPELPELTKEFFDRIGLESEAQLDEEIRSTLQRQVTYDQRQAVRRQVLGKITESANWDLPEHLVLKQVENALRREMLEMQQAGFTNQEIQRRENVLRQRAVSTTRQALKEHFVLDKIATTEKIQVEPADIEFEIRLMAMQRGESPRRVRARLTKSGVIENLEAQIRERKAVDLILSKATFTDVKVSPKDEEDFEAISRSVCGMGAAEQEVEESDEESES